MDDSFLGHELLANPPTRSIPSPTNTEAGMPHIVDTLCESMRERRGLPARPSHATITVVRTDVPPDVTRYSGIVLIDRRFIGYLVGGRPREFRVPTGTHKVEAYLGGLFSATRSV